MEAECDVTRDNDTAITKTITQRDGDDTLVTDRRDEDTVTESNDNRSSPQTSLSRKYTDTEVKDTTIDNESNEYTATVENAPIQLTKESTNADFVNISYVNANIATSDTKCKDSIVMKTETEDASNKSTETVKNASVQLQQMETSNQIDKNAEPVNISYENATFTAATETECNDESKIVLGSTDAHLQPTESSLLKNEDSNVVAYKSCDAHGIVTDTSENASETIANTSIHHKQNETLCQSDEDADLMEAKCDITRDNDTAITETIRQSDDDDTLVTDKSDKDSATETNENRSAPREQKAISRKDTDTEVIETTTDEESNESTETIENAPVQFQQVEILNQISTNVDFVNINYVDANITATDTKCKDSKDMKTETEDGSNKSVETVKHASVQLQQTETSNQLDQNGDPANTSYENATSTAATVTKCNDESKILPGSTNAHLQPTESAWLKNKDSNIVAYKSCDAHGIITDTREFASETITNKSIHHKKNDTLSQSDEDAELMEAECDVTRDNDTAITKTITQRDGDDTLVTDRRDEDTVTESNDNRSSPREQTSLSRKYTDTEVKDTTIDNESNEYTATVENAPIQLTKESTNADFVNISYVNANIATSDTKCKDSIVMKTETEDASNKSTETVKNASVQLQQMETSNQIDKNAEPVNISYENATFTAATETECNDESKIVLGSTDAHLQPTESSLLKNEDSNVVAYKSCDAHGIVTDTSENASETIANTSIHHKQNETLCQSDEDADLMEAKCDITRDNDTAITETIRQSDDDDTLVTDKSDKDSATETNENRSAPREQKAISRKDTDTEVIETTTDEESNESTETIENAPVQFQQVEILNQISTNVDFVNINYVNANIIATDTKCKDSKDMKTETEDGSNKSVETVKHASVQLQQTETSNQLDQNGDPANTSYENATSTAATVTKCNDESKILPGSTNAHLQPTESAWLKNKDSNIVAYKSCDAHGIITDTREFASETITNKSIHHKKNDTLSQSDEDAELIEAKCDVTRDNDTAITETIRQREGDDTLVTDRRDEDTVTESNDNRSSPREQTSLSRKYTDTEVKDTTIDDESNESTATVENAPIQLTEESTNADFVNISYVNANIATSDTKCKDSIVMKTETEDASNKSTETVKNASVQLQQMETSNQIDKNAEPVNISNENATLTAATETECNDESKIVLGSTDAHLQPTESSWLKNEDSNVFAYKNCDAHGIITDTSENASETIANTSIHHKQNETLCQSDEDADLMEAKCDITRDNDIAITETIRQSDDDDTLVTDRSDKDSATETNENRSAPREQKAISRKDTDTEVIENTTDEESNESTETIVNAPVQFQQVEILNQISTNADFVNINYVNANITATDTKCKDSKDMKTETEDASNKSTETVKNASVQLQQTETSSQIDQDGDPANTSYDNATFTAATVTKCNDESKILPGSTNAHLQPTESAWLKNKDSNIVAYKSCDAHGIITDTREFASETITNTSIYHKKNDTLSQSDEDADLMEAECDVMEAECDVTRDTDAAITETIRQIDGDDTLVTDRRDEDTVTESNDNRSSPREQMALSRKYTDTEVKDTTIDDESNEYTATVENAPIQLTKESTNADFVNISYVNANIAANDTKCKDSIVMKTETEDASNKSTETVKNASVQLQQMETSNQIDKNAEPVIISYENATFTAATETKCNDESKIVPGSTNANLQPTESSWLKNEDSNIVAYKSCNAHGIITDTGEITSETITNSSIHRKLNDILSQSNEAADLMEANSDVTRTIDTAITDKIIQREYDNTIVTDKRDEDNITQSNETRSEPREQKVLNRNINDTEVTKTKTDNASNESTDTIENASVPLQQIATSNRIDKYTDHFNISYEKTNLIATVTKCNDGSEIVTESTRAQFQQTESVCLRNEDSNIVSYKSCDVKGIITDTGEIASETIANISIHHKQTEANSDVTRDTDTAITENMRQRGKDNTLVTDKRDGDTITESNENHSAPREQNDLSRECNDTEMSHQETISQENKNVYPVTTKNNDADDVVTEKIKFKSAELQHTEPFSYSLNDAGLLNMINENLQNEGTYAELRKTSEEFKMQAKIFENDNMVLRNANKRLKRKELANRKKIINLLNEVDMIKNKEKHIAEKNIELSAEIRRQETEIIENKKMLKSVSAENEVLHAANWQMQKKNSKLNAKESDLTNALANQINESKALQKELLLLKKRNKVLTDDNDEFKIKLYAQEKLTTELKTETNTLKEHIKKYTSEFENLNDVNNELKESNKLLQAVIDSYQPTYEDLLQKEMKWTNEWHTLVKEHDAVRAERLQVDETRNKSEEMKADLNAKAAEIDKKHKEMLEKEIELETTIENLKSSLTASEDYAVSIKRDLDTAKNEISNYQSTLKDRSTEYDALKARLQDTECSLGKAALVLKETQGQLNVVTTSTVALREENRKLVEERVHLTSQMIKERENTGKLNVFISNQYINK